MGNLKPGDDQRDPCRLKNRVECSPDALSNGHEVRGEFFIKIDPMVDLRFWYDKRVAWCQWCDREEGGALLISIYESTR